MKIREALTILGRKNILFIWIIVYFITMLFVIIVPGSKPLIYNLYAMTVIVFIVMLPMYLWTARLSDRIKVSKIKDGYIIKEVKK